MEPSGSLVVADTQLGSVLNRVSKKQLVHCGN